MPTRDDVLACRTGRASPTAPGWRGAFCRSSPPAGRRRSLRGYEYLHDPAHLTGTRKAVWHAERCAANARVLYEGAMYKAHEAAAVAAGQAEFAAELAKTSPARGRTPPARLPTPPTWPSAPRSARASRTGTSSGAGRSSMSARGRPVRRLRGRGERGHRRRLPAAQAAHRGEGLDRPDAGAAARLRPAVAAGAPKGWPEEE